MANDNKKILLTGVKPTGRPHIGNYLGAMKPIVDMQGDYETYVMIADYHALTGAQMQGEPETLEQYILDLAIDFLAIGLDPEKTVFFQQSAVREHTELAWIFNCITTMPYLMRAHAFKDAEAKDKDLSVGTFDYPMLMASDILLYGTNVVPVGQDQKQHLEFARDTAEKFNRLYGETFTVPEPKIDDEVAVIPGTDGQKMSKSYKNTIPLFATDEELKKAVMSIVTDSKDVDEEKDPNNDNVFALHRLFSKDILNDLQIDFKGGGLGYKESKELLLENIIRTIKPLREKRAEIADNKEMVLTTLARGADKASEKAEQKLHEVRAKIGVAIK